LSPGRHAHRPFDEVDGRSVYDLSGRLPKDTLLAMNGNLQQAMVEQKGPLGHRMNPRRIGV